MLLEIVHLNEQITSLRQKIELLQKNETTNAVEVEKLEEKLTKMKEKKTMQKKAIVKKGNNFLHVLNNLQVFCKIKITSSLNLTSLKNFN